MIDSSRINLLLNRYADGDISKPEFDELISFIQSPENVEEFSSAVDSLYFDGEQTSFHSRQQEEAIFQKLLASRPTAQIVPLSHIKLWVRYAAAAIVLLFCAVGIYLYTFSGIQYSKLTGNDITPAKDKAYLLMSDGARINLDNLAQGQTLKKNGMTISRSKDGYFSYSIADSLSRELESTLVTPRGGHYQIKLPDGTKVWLNSESSLSFPTKFSNLARTVRLQGEAYFEVAKKYKGKNKANSSGRLPFHVLTAKQRVDVLGTHFNIRAYAGESPAATTLVEGAVSVNILDARGGVSASSVLSPGQQGINNGESIKVQSVDIEEQMAWKNGLFVFKGKSLVLIMKEVSRWYDVDVVFENESLKRNTFSGSTSRFEDISALLEVLETTGSVHFKVEGRRVIVKE